MNEETTFKTVVFGTVEEYILKMRPYFELPMCMNASAKVFDLGEPTMIVLCREHADLEDHDTDLNN